MNGAAFGTRKSQKKKAEEYHLPLNLPPAQDPNPGPLEPFHLPQELQGDVASEPLSQHLGTRSSEVVIAQPGKEDRN